MKIHPVSIFKFSSSLLALALLSGCASQLKTPTAAQLREIKRIDLVVDVPQSNFSYTLNNQTVYAQPTIGMSLGAGVAINLAANLLAAGMEYALTSVAREAQGPVGKSVENFDLRGAVYEQLKSLQKQTPGAPEIRVSVLPFPKIAEKADTVKLLQAHAKFTDADASLYVSMAPSFRDANHQTAVAGSAWLVTRSGDVLLATHTEFVGPAHPQLQQTEVVRWWAENRYRRFLVQGTRAVLSPVSDALSRPLLDDSQRAEAEAKINRLPVRTSNGERLRSTLCTLESDDATVIYRFERQRHNLRVAAFCPGETLALLEPDLVPGVSWLSAPQVAASPK